MKLEYLDDLDGDGKYPDVWPSKLIRLFDFDERQNQQLIQLFSHKLISQRAEIELETIDFIAPLNCRLRLRLSAIDKGIIKLAEPNSFAFDLTTEGYLAVIEAMRNVGDGHNWLTDVADTDIEFLYSAGGTW